MASPALETRKLSGKQLSRIPDEELKEAQKIHILDLSMNPLLQLDGGIAAFVNLLVLQLSNCGLTKLPEEIQRLQTLEQLDIGGNNFEALPDVVTNLRNLKVLVMRQCKTLKLPKSIENLRMLHSLDLSVNSLTCLPDSIGNLQNLVQLNLNDNMIQELPASMSQLVKLETFLVGMNVLGGPSQKTIFHNPLLNGEFRLTFDFQAHFQQEYVADLRWKTATFRSLIANMANLIVLDVTNCGLLDLPLDVANHKKLQRLVIDRNPLRGFPPATTMKKMLNCLSVLEIRQCELLELPPAIAELSSLTTLDASVNKLSKLSDWIGELVKLSILRLAQNEIKSLPDNLAILTELTVLDITANKLSALPYSIGALMQLSELKLADNLLTALPVSIGNLSSLAHLNLDGNMIAALPESIGNLPKLTYFSMSPIKAALQIDQRGNLHQVIPANTTFSLKSLPSSIGRLLMLSTLNIPGNHLTKLPPSIKDLVNLNTLNIAANKIVALPETIGGLVNIKVLNACFNMLDSLPNSFRNLKNLEHLDIGMNSRLEVFPAPIAELTNLKILSIAGCGILKGLPKIASLTNLEYLNLSKNKLLKAVPLSVMNMHRLTHLDISGCKLSHLPLEMAQLTALTILDISGNQRLRSLPPVVISGLRNLQILNVASCNISELPMTISKLHSLNVVIASNNRFDQFPGCVLELQSLTELDLSNSIMGRNANAIKELPSELAIRPASLRFLNVTGNAIRTPPESICELGLPAIRHYLRDMHLGGKLFCADSVSMLGDTEAGKSSLVMSLREQRPCATSEADRTHVLQQGTIKLDDCYVNVNDFGGHPIYHAVLPMFLPRKGLGILAYNMSHPWNDQEKAVRKWITTVISRSPGMHLVVVGTHSDMLPTEMERAELKRKMTTFVKDTFDAAKTELKDLIANRKSNVSSPAPVKQYGTLHATETETVDQTRLPFSAVKETCHSLSQDQYMVFLQNTLRSLESSKQVVLSLSCKKTGGEGDSISKLKHTLLKLIERGQEMPSQWIQFMDSLLCYKSPDTLTFIKIEKVKDLCTKDCGKSDMLDTILGYLSNISKIIYHDSHQKLAGCVFHRTSVVLDICKAVLHDGLPTAPGRRAEDLSKYRDGLVTESLLHCLLEEYKEEANTIIELMKAFNIICRGSGTRNPYMILPCRLPDEEPGAQQWIDDQREAIERVLPAVHIRIIFFTTLTPFSLFESSLASLLNDLSTTGKAEPTYWKNGLSYKMDSSKFRYERTEDCIEVKAIAGCDESVQDMCKELNSLLDMIAQHIKDIWPGSIPTVHFICPTCIYKSHNRNEATHWRSAFIDELIRDVEPPASKFHCKTCEKDVPRALFYKCKPEHLGPAQLHDVKEFLENIRKGRQNGRQSPAEMRRQSELATRFREARPNLTRALDESTVLHLVDVLYSKMIINEFQKAEIEAKVIPFKMARELIDRVETRGTEAIVTFLRAVCSDDIGRRDLAQPILGDYLPSMPMDCS